MSDTNFAELGLCEPLVAAVTRKGYKTPSPIQEQAIPAVLAGRDVMAAAQTGTGKTAGFTLPILHQLSDAPRAKGNRVKALILTPTRELAAQIGDNLTDYAAQLPIRNAVVYGGVKINPQMQQLRRGVEVLVACPGRLLDLYNQNAVRFDDVEFLVLDEADRMLDMGFIHDIKRILAKLPAKRQNLLFSATFSPDIRALAQALVKNPVEIDVSPRNSTTHLVEQWLVPIDKSRKAKALLALVDQNNWQQVLVFSRTKHGANRLAKQLSAAKITAAAIHGDKSQGARTRALAEFKAGKVRVLVATDIAARGLDISELPHVINFDLPNVAADYVHRIGRTGRAGAFGQALSLVCAAELEDLEHIEGLIGQSLERRPLEGFEPSEPLPASRPRVPKKPKKPKKPKVAAILSDKSEAPRRPEKQPERGQEGRGRKTPNENRRRRARPSAGKVAIGSDEQAAKPKREYASTRSDAPLGRAPRKRVRRRQAETKSQIEPKS
ncbi:MAG: DEAD/DEAH box helicase [Pontibacterium sp.]